MALSDYERQMLEELEAQLADEDPSFAKTMKPENVSPPSGRQMSLRNIVIGMLIAVVGIALLVLSIALPLIPLGVVGVVVMGLGFWYAGSPTKSGKVPAPAAPAADKSPKKQGPSFMERQAQRWEKRQEQ